MAGLYEALSGISNDDPQDDYAEGKRDGREEERSEWLAAVDELCKIAVNEETVVGENLNAVAYLQELKARMAK